jgi:mono/diheme cytochrome c family protein
MEKHILREEMLQSLCFYCNKKIPVKEWKSEFEHYFHYKIAECAHCHRINRIKLGFGGSGHDRWAEGLEKIVISEEKASEKK